LLKDIERISVWKGIQSVFCGLTWAVFTPNRIGEYGGRILFLENGNRARGVVAMAVGAFGQMAVTNILGAAAMTWFVHSFTSSGPVATAALALVSAGLTVLLLLLYFNIALLRKPLLRIRILRRFSGLFNVLSSYNKRELSSIFAYSAARYAVFTCQYYLIIHMLLPHLAAGPMLGMVFILFFIQSALPTLDLVDVGVRAMTATYFFHFITQEEVAIIASTAFIWLVNLIIPAILGAAFVFKIRLFDTNR
jgi:hypothetical protein